jgi:radical SAM superfamily enzyme YgiQ (UPF0313 family)
LACSKSRIRELPDEMSYLLPYYGRPDLSPFALFHQFRHFGYSFGTIGQRAGESGAFLVGISSLFTPYVNEALRTAETVKAHLPNTKIVLGGHHPTAMPESAMDSEAVDFVIRGDGEVAMPLLARAISEGGGYDAIPGLGFKTQDGTRQINPAARTPHLDDYPLPAVRLINQKFYSRKSGGSTVIVASRGCPLKCSYCCFGDQSDQRFRIRSVAAVISEIEQFALHNNSGLIDFEDENLALNRRWFLKLLKTITDRFGESRFELRAMNGLYPPSIDEEIVDAMKKAGFRTLNLSLGSTCEQQLKRFNRPDVSVAFDRALELAERYGLDAVGYVICAAPFQRVEDSISDLLYLAARRVLAGVSVFYPAPGSRDYELCRQQGILPVHLACMRSSALPLSHTTSRTETVTLLRLARILNFMKSLLDQGVPIPDASPAGHHVDGSGDRIEIGRRLTAKFLTDGRIRGITPEGELYDHLISETVSRNFLARLKKINLKGTRGNHS